MKTSFNQKLFLFSLLLLAGIGFTGYVVYKSNQKLSESARWVQHTEQIIYESGNILSLTKDIQAAARGYAMTRDTDFLSPLYPAEADIFKNIERLRGLVKDNPSQLPRIDSLAWYARTRLDFSYKTIRVRNENGLQAALDLTATKEGKRYTDRIRQITADIQAEENVLLKARQQDNERSVRVFNRVWMGMFVLMAVFTILFFTAVGNYMLQQKKHAQEIKRWNDNLQQKINEIADFKALFESAPGLFLILLPDLVIDGVSDEYLTATMTKREEITGRHLFEVFPDNPDDAQADGVSNLRASLNTVLKTKAAHAMAIQKYDIRRTDGTFEERYWSPFNKPVLNAQGEVVYIIHSVQDVTQRIKDEAELLRATGEIKELYNKAPCGYFSVDANILMSNVNETLLQWLGYTAEEMLGKMKYEDLLSDESREQHLSTFETVFADYVKNGYVNDLEYVFKRKDGTTFPALVNSIAVLDDSGNFVSSRSTVFDYTERNKAEEKLKSVNKELEAFSYSVSHDLRAPLRAVHGYTQILLEDYQSKLDEEALRLMNNIMGNAKKMGQLIDDLLAFSRLGRKELMKQTISMQDMVANVCDELTIAEHSGKLEFVIGNLPKVQADAVTIKQVWVNLISNAMKYSKLKPKQVIEIGAQTNNHEITYYIKDNGAGFDMRYANKLFGVFQRLHTEQEFEGTGVGLAIVQRVIAKHGGRVWAEGKVGEGAVFSFALPRV